MGPQSQQTVASEIISHSLRRPPHWTRMPAISNGPPIDSLAI